VKPRQKSEFAVAQSSCHAGKFRKGDGTNAIRLPPSASKASQENLSAKIAKGSTLHTCHLCNIVFGSAQALGGHRANSAEHAEKLAKQADEEQRRCVVEETLPTSRERAQRLPTSSCHKEEEDPIARAEQDHKLEEDATSSVAGIRLPPSASKASKEYLSAKIAKGSTLHTCQLCNIVFANAQALGGHYANSAEHAARLAKLSDEKRRGDLQISSLPEREVMRFGDPSRARECYRDDAPPSSGMLSWRPQEGACGGSASAASASKRPAEARLQTSWSHKKQKTSMGTEPGRALEEDATSGWHAPDGANTNRHEPQAPPQPAGAAVSHGEAGIHDEAAAGEGPGVTRPDEEDAWSETGDGFTQGMRGYRGPQGAVCQCGREEGVTLTSRGKPTRGFFSKGVFRCDRCYKRFKRANRAKANVKTWAGSEEIGKRRRKEKLATARTGAGDSAVLLLGRDDAVEVANAGVHGMVQSLPDSNGDAE